MSRVLQAIASSDWHLHYWEHHNAEGSRTHATIEFVENLFKRARKVGVPIFFSGDLFHTPEGLKSPTINSVYPELIRIFNEYSDVDFYAITGNHDQYTKNYIHKPSISYTAGLANTLKNFHLLDMTGVVLENNVGVFGIPYLYLNQGFDEALTRAESFFERKGVSKSILLIHTTIEGSVDTNGYSITESSIMRESLSDRFTLVLAGHIHKFQKMAKGVYHVGSAVHVKASDADYEPVTLDILNPLGNSSLKVRTRAIPEARVFKYYTDLEDKYEDENIMWVHRPVEKAEEEHDDIGVDFSDLPGLMRGYLKKLGVKSPMRIGIAMNTLKEVIDDTVE